MQYSACLVCSYFSIFLRAYYILLLFFVTTESFVGCNYTISFHLHVMRMTNQETLTLMSTFCPM